MSIEPTRFVTGLLVGGIAGAALGTLCAPCQGPALTAMREHRRIKAQEPAIDDQSEQSFPASDPPSWTPTTSTSAS